MLAFSPPESPMKNKNLIASGLSLSEISARRKCGVNKKVNYTAGWKEN